MTGKSESPRAAPSPTALSALPAAPAVFTGREDEVAELLGALDPGVGGGSESVVISAVSGLGGVGKTALALCVAHEARGRGWFSGGALFVDLRGYDDVPVTADQAVLALLRALGVGDTDLPPTADEQYARYRGELSSREPVLIVLDNASDPAQIVPLLPGEGGGHRVLVTSREVQDSLPVRQFRVDGLSPDASRDLIERSLRLSDPGDRRVADEPEAVRQLAELCGHLPLALLIVSALLRRRRQRPVSTLVGELRTAEDRVRALRAKGVDQYGKELSLRPVFDVMYARMEPELARVFRLLGQAPGSDIGLGPATSLTVLPPEKLRPLLDDLAAASLVTPSPGGGRWQMHDLVRLYAQAVAAGTPELEEEAKSARRSLLFYYAQGAWAAKFTIRGERDDEVPDLFDGSLVRALSWCDSERTGLVTAALWTESDDPVQTRCALGLAIGLESYLNHHRAYSEWATVARAACVAAHRLEDPEDEAEAWDSLGRALYGLRRFEEALDSYGHAVRIYAELGDKDGQAQSWNNLGIALRELRRSEEAVDAYTHSLNLFIELDNHHAAAAALSNIGTLLADRGQLGEAHACLTEALEIHCKVGDLQGEAGTWCNLGVVLLHLDRAEEAHSHLTHALGLCAELGNWHGRAQAWNNLGRVLLSLGRLNEAIAAHTRARDWYAALDDSHSEALASLNLACTLLDLDRNEEGLEAARRARDLYEACDDWFGVGDALTNIGAAHSAQLLLREAADAWIRAAHAYDRSGAAEEAASARRRVQA
ncbi:tetratricopeptide repeat protein [Streptomyces sp. NBC_00986]|uniref:tetratricopeptide repeat protein n=1 Tax=Streptomyces sp. NBC_00986 TaxID=2903702 RepID=UPI00386AEBF6|nr:tetratricopeptide repeat protein [Streptomyces sp. NBC_00986]